MNYSKYNKSRLNTILSGLVPSFLAPFTRHDRNFIVLNSFHNMQFNDNTKAFFLFLINNTQYKVRYVVNDPELRQQLENQYGHYFIETVSFTGKMQALKAHTWIVNSFEMPVGGFFLKAGRTVIHLSHGVPIKNIGLMEKDLSFVKRVYYKLLKINLSYTLVPTDALADFTKRFIGVKDRNLLICGYPRYDPVIEKKFLEKQDDIIRILYAPTWRHFSEIRLFPFDDFDIKTFNDFCVSRNIEIHLRVHPRFQDHIPSELFKYPCIKNCSGDVEPDINESLHKFDMLITDYSSIFYDYYLLDRPIFYFDYDHAEYEEKVGFAVDYDTFAVGYRTHSMKEFFSQIEDALNVDSFKTQREAMNVRCNGSSPHNSLDLLNEMKKRGIIR